MKVNLPTIKLEGNEYNVYNDEGDFLIGFERAILGDQVAKKLAETYCGGYEQGRDDQAEV